MLNVFKVLKDAQDDVNNVTVTYLKFENIEYTVVTHSGHNEILIKKKNYENLKEKKLKHKVKSISLKIP